jgi:hypothetical protein
LGKSDIELALEPVIKLFEEMRISYYLCGSLASSAYGLSRTTQDIDLVSDISLRNVISFVENLKEEYFIDAEMIRDAIKNRTSFNLIHLETMFKIDIFILKDDPYSIATLNRIQEDSLDQGKDSLKILIISSEDVILSKLIWFKLGNEISERQWLDILGVIKVQSESLDKKYLTLWAKQKNVYELLTKAFKECDILI